MRAGAPFALAIFPANFLSFHGYQSSRWTSPVIFFNRNREALLLDLIRSLLPSIKHYIFSSPLEKENSEGFNSSLFNSAFPTVPIQIANEWDIRPLEQPLPKLVTLPSPLPELWLQATGKWMGTGERLRGISQPAMLSLPTARTELSATYSSFQVHTGLWWIQGNFLIYFNSIDNTLLVLPPLYLCKREDLVAYLSHAQQYLLWEKHWENYKERTVILLLSPCCFSSMLRGTHVKRLQSAQQSFRISKQPLLIVLMVTKMISLN